MNLTREQAETLAALRAEAARVTTPEQATALAIRAVHYSRTIDDGVPTRYQGARNARRFLELVMGTTLADEADSVRTERPKTRRRW